MTEEEEIGREVLNASDKRYDDGKSARREMMKKITRLLKKFV